MSNGKTPRLQILLKHLRKVTWRTIITVLSGTIASIATVDLFVFQLRHPAMTEMQVFFARGWWEGAIIFIGALVMCTLMGCDSPLSHGRRR